MFKLNIEHVDFLTNLNAMVGHSVMKIIINQTVVAVVVCLLLTMVVGCQPSNKNKPHGENIFVIQQPKPNEVVDVNSLDELYQLFKQQHYSQEDWQAGHNEVPRILFNRVHKRWQETSSKMPVTTKKDVFFRLMAPLILMVNEQIEQQRIQVKAMSLTDPLLREVMVEYRVLDKEQQRPLTQADKTTLLKRLDIIPPSLALAQAAEESGWATSRFTYEGNAFFGQWDYSGKGMKPKSQRTELGNYGIARFDSPFDSVKAYATNINRGHAYQQLRDARAILRSNGEEISGLALAKTLDKYSERGQAYIDSISHMITYNKLMSMDRARLATGPTILIKTK